MTKVKIKLNTVNDVREFVNIMTKCKADAYLKKHKYVVDPKSIMGIFSLDLSEPINLKINAEENEIEDILKQINKFIV